MDTSGIALSFFEVADETVVVKRNPLGGPAPSGQDAIKSGLALFPSAKTDEMPFLFASEK